MPSNYSNYMDFNSSWSDVTLPLHDVEETESKSSRASLPSPSSSLRGKNRADVIRHKYAKNQELKRRMRSFHLENNKLDELQRDVANVKESLAALEQVLKGMQEHACVDCNGSTGSHNHIKKSPSSSSLSLRSSIASTSTTSTSSSGMRRIKSAATMASRTSTRSRQSRRIRSGR